jgi:hypothetical protein
LILRRCVEIEDTSFSLYYELFRAQKLLEKASIGSDDGDSFEMNLKRLWKSKYQREWALKDKTELLSQLRSLCDFQAEVLASEQSRKATDAYLKSRPDIVVNRVVSHIQYLFDVKSIDGILPKLNQVYICNEEMRNFFSTVRLMLKVDSATSYSTLIPEILTRLSHQ